MSENILRHARTWLIDLQLADDPKQFLLAQIIARMEILQEFADREERGCGIQP